MTIRCPECGYENRDMYRFCGMCGATLRLEPQSGTPVVPQPTAAPVVTKPETKVEPQIAPSRLAAPEPAPHQDLQYLLEDEPPKSRGKLYLTLMLLVLAVGVLAWQWRKGEHPSAAEPAPVASPAASAASSTPAPVAPAPPIAKDGAPAQKPQNTAPAPKPATSQDTDTSDTANNTMPTSPSAQDAPPAKPESAEAGKPAAPDANTPAQADSPAPVETADATPATTPPPKPKAERKVVAPPAPVLKGDDKLVVDGEKYLYGTGVPQDCDLAQKNLKVAAAHSNARALTLMGAMYFTGHCVGRDLPTAYRWFAKALHQDPSNSRVQQDLEILWKQMTPEERQLATKNGN